MVLVGLHKTLERMVDFMKHTLQSILVFAGVYLGWFLGGFDGLMHTLVIFVVIDYITGVMTAIVRKEVSSEVGAKGIFKKVMIFMLVGIAHITDIHVIETGSALRTAVICFYLSNEAFSILENVALMGLPVPEKLKQILSKIEE